MAGFETMSQVAGNLLRLRERIDAACRRVSRNPDDVTLVAVTKTVGPDKIRQAIDAGVEVLGENRVQEAAPKIEALVGLGFGAAAGRDKGPAAGSDSATAGVDWHMIGHLQRNKVKKAVTMFDMIQSVDSFDLAAEIDRRCDQIDKVMEILIEVNTSGEGTKYGVSPEETIDLVRRISHLNNTSIMGLMTIGAFTDDENSIRSCFRTLRDLARQVEGSDVGNAEMRYLSMGMTSDFELAIEEGSNLVRIGTAIFGPRQG
jgi:pyridoxal phosphate enzyme (YggS family)